MRKFVLLLAAAALLGLAAVPAMAAERKVQVKAGPIWNNDDAQAKCEALASKVAQKYGGKTVSWDGTWRTTVEGKESVCVFVIED